MKANELRIGNLFIGYSNKPFSWALKHFELLSSGVDLSEIIKHPIQLTENRLEDFGFYKNQNVWWDETECCNIYNGYFRIGTYKIKKVRYVHELQNIYFALTGEELILKLTEYTNGN